jgi:hypothetical protein
VKRRWLNLFALLSLIFSLATVALWVRSRHGGQSFERVDPERRIVITSVDGLIQIRQWDGDFSSPLASVFQFSHAPPRAWMQWAYWHGHSDDITQDGPNDWAYEPGIGRDHWWQDAGFDWFDEQVVPRRNTTYIHDWLPPDWRGRWRQLSFPHWALLPWFMLLPAIYLNRNNRRQSRRRAGLCSNCGYDLRATPQRCPECGEVPVTV